MADISQIKLPPNNTTYNLVDAYKSGIYTVIGTQTAATGAWTGVLHGVSALYDGLTIMYYLPYAGSGNATLNLTLDSGSTTGAVNCYYSTGRLTTHYGAGCNIVMTYWSAGSIKVNGTATTDNRWIANANYTDGNSLAYNVTNYYNRFKAGANKIFPYTIIMQCSDGRWESIVTSSSTGTSKARNTHGFRLGQIALMYANATYNENATVGDNIIQESKTDLIDHRYSFNTANNSTNGTTAVKPVYLVGALNATDGLFYLDTTWWTQTLPTTANGKLYIYLGDAYDYYRMTFRIHHPIYWYSNGKVREFHQDSATVNGHTVDKDVPSNAVFTDTNNAVTQTNITTAGDYRVLLSNSNDDTTTTGGVYKNSNFLYNPSTHKLNVGGIESSGDITSSGSIYSNGTIAGRVISAKYTSEGSEVTQGLISMDNDGIVNFTSPMEKALKDIKVRNATSADSATDSSKLGGASPSESATASTIVKRNSSGYVYAVYYNEANGAENPASYTSYAVFKDSNGWLRCSTLANFKAWFGAANYATLTNAGSTTGTTAKGFSVPAAATEIIVTGRFSSKILSTCVPKALLTSSNQEIWLTGGKSAATNGNDGALRCLCYLKISGTTVTLTGLTVNDGATDKTSSTTWNLFYR